MATRESNGELEAGNPWFLTWSIQLAFGLIQLVLAASTSIWVELAERPLGLSEAAGVPFGNPGFQIFRVLVIGVVGGAEGALVATMFTRARRSARWVWTLPVCIVLLSIASDTRQFHSWRAILEQYFYDPHPGVEEGSLLRELMAYPALSSLMYSIGAALAAGIQGRRKSAGGSAGQTE